MRGSFHVSFSRRIDLSINLLTNAHLQYLKLNQEIEKDSKVELCGEICEGRLTTSEISGLSVGNFLKSTFSKMQREPHSSGTNNNQHGKDSFETKISCNDHLLWDFGDQIEDQKQFRLIDL